MTTAAASRLGLSLAEYQARRDAGEKWCTGCKDWHPVAEFAHDSSRSDGLRAACRASRATPRKTPAARFHAKTRKAPSGCIEWTGSKYPSGYGSFYFDGRTQPAHRVAWILKHGAIHDSLCVLHRCDNPPCVNDEHLFLGTKSDNAADMMAKGRHADQARTLNGNARLTEADVAVIRSARSKRSQSDLARQFGVTKTTIRKVQLRQTWQEFPA